MLKVPAFLQALDQPATDTWTDSLIYQSGWTENNPPKWTSNNQPTWTHNSQMFMSNSIQQGLTSSNRLAWTESNEPKWSDNNQQAWSSSSNDHERINNNQLAWSDHNQMEWADNNNHLTESFKPEAPPTFSPTTTAASDATLADVTPKTILSQMGQGRFY
jgi:hypothetical protein